MTDSPFATEGRPAREPPKSRSYKKYVIIAAVSGGILALAVILTGILVGVRPFTHAQKDIMRFSYHLDGNTKEEMMSDPNINMVMYHVTCKEYKAWLFNDFNRDIQVMKVQTDLETNCFVTALNRTMAKEPSIIKPPSANEMSNGTHMPNMTRMTYRSADTPISDLTFMCQTARNACSGIPTYWLFPICTDSDDIERRPKRSWRDWFQIFISLAQLIVEIVKIKKGSS